MVNKLLLKEVFNSIKKEPRKFISLICIIALGVGFYVGMNTATPVLKNTMSNYFAKTNFMDYQILSEIGITQNELETLKNKVSEIESIEGGYRTDVVTTMSNSEIVVSVLSYDPNSKLNKLSLKQGAMPKNIHECVVDEKVLKWGYNIGDTIYLNNEHFADQDLTITGVVKSPLYITNDRGNTNLLSGKVQFYIYSYKDNFLYDNYTLGYIKTKNNYYVFSDKYDNYIEETKLKLINEFKTISQTRLSEMITEYEKKINKMQSTYDQKKNSAIKALEEANEKISIYEQQINSGYDQLMTEEEITAYLKEQKQLLDASKEELDKAKTKIEEAKKAYNSAVTSNILIKSWESQKKTAETLLTNYKEQLEKYNEKLTLYQQKYDAASTTLRKKTMQSYIDYYTKNIEKIQKQIDDTENLIVEYDNQIKELTDKNYSYLIESAEQEYNIKYDKYTVALKAYNNATKNMYTEMDTARENLDSKNQQLALKKAELNAEVARVTIELEEANNEIAEARDKLERMKNSDWNTYTRNDNAGYSQFSSNVESILNLSKFFPLIFFLVTCLVTLTSVSRTVEVERMQIGTLIAIGYNKKQVVRKYIFHSTLSLFFGSIIGICIGLFLIPFVIYKVYSMMYSFPSINFQFNAMYIAFGILLASCCTILTTFIIVNNAVTEIPYRLMRPKITSGGKRIFLEKINFIWKQLKFLDKITFRNLFRYKKRLLMTIVGVMGCTALIISGFGLQKAITSIIPMQYGEIFKLDVQLFYKDDITRSTIKTENERIASLDNVKYAVPIRMESIDMKQNNKTYNVYLLVSENNEELKNIITLKNPTTQQEITLPTDGVVITEKLSNQLQVTIGDTINYTDSNGDNYNVVVSYITENYVDHYMYMSSSYYETTRNITPRNNVLIVKAMKDYNQSEYASILNSNNYFSSMRFISAAQVAYDEITTNLNIIVIMIIIAAGFLIFVVLYNLAILNIDERKKEIATLKVLGFKEKEVNNYVKKEMRILTYIGIIIGLVAGYYLTNVVIKYCEIDALMYNKKLYLQNYIFSVIITIGFLYIVNLIISKEIKKINMIESLKSVE